MKLNKAQLTFWKEYLSTLKEKPADPTVTASIAGHPKIADETLAFFLSGKKSAGSGLVKDYEYSAEELPEAGAFWIVLDSTKTPRCILKTVKVETYKFGHVPKKVALAEGESSIEAWRDQHIDYFQPYLEDWGVENLDKEDIIVEFFEVVHR